jgi:site-specific DNA recombinase
VREIFDRYVAGWSPGRIAADLNRRGVPSPGSTWERTVRRSRGWMQSAIRADAGKGTGILGNDLYVGRHIWNRSQWVKDPDTGRRKYVLRHQSDWIINEIPELRIITDEVWQAARARGCAQAERIGAAVHRGIALRKARPPGGVPKYLLSGLLTCGECGSKFIIVNRTSYGCGGYLNGKLCSNGLIVKRSLAEQLLLAGIRADLLTPEVEAEVRQRFAKKIAERPAPAEQAPQGVAGRDHQPDGRHCRRGAAGVTGSRRAAGPG